MGHIKKNVQLEREVSELKQQMAGVTRANLIKHMNKNKQLEREIMELKQQLLEAKQTVAARDETIKHLQTELAKANNTAEQKICGSRVVAANHSKPNQPPSHLGQGRQGVKHQQKPTSKTPSKPRRFAELGDFFGAIPAAPKLAPGETPVNPYQNENEPVVNRKIELILNQLKASEKRRLCHDREFLKMKITQAKVQLFKQYKEHAAAKANAVARTPIQPNIYANPLR